MKGGGATELGFIAQDVEGVFPELVRTNPDGFKTLNYVGLIAPLVEAANEQRRQIDALRAENRTLARRLDALEGR